VYERERERERGYESKVQFLMNFDEDLKSKSFKKLKVLK